MSGGALRVYQFLTVALIGWGIGRLPALWQEAQADAQVAASPPPRAIAPPRPAPPSAPAPTLSEAQASALASQVAAGVAAQVASATIARLVAAGWGPPLPPSRRPAMQVADTAATGWTLPPALPAPQALASVPPSPAAPPEPSKAAPNPAFARATTGYAALKQGDRRAAAEALAEAVRLDPEAPQARDWARDLRQLTRRWHGEAFVQFREGVNEGLAASPVLGGGQTGAALSFTPDPLASAPFRIVARYSAAHNAKGSIDPATAEAALGLRWQIDPRLAIDIERRFAIGVLGRSTWAARISGGLSGSYRLFGRNATWDSYAEAGALGITRVSSYAGIQGRTGVPLLDLRSLSLDAGIGAWASGQQIYGLGNIGRIDLGPSLRLGSRSFPISGQLDYRWRAVGNVFPGSGPVFTVTGRF